MLLPYVRRDLHTSSHGISMTLSFENDARIKGNDLYLPLWSVGHDRPSMRLMPCTSSDAQGWCMLRTPYGLVSCGVDLAPGPR